VGIVFCCWLCNGLAICLRCIPQPLAKCVQPQQSHMQWIQSNGLPVLIQGVLLQMVWCVLELIVCCNTQDQRLLTIVSMQTFFMISLWCEHMHPSYPPYLLYTILGGGGLAHIPAAIGREAGYTLDKTSLKTKPPRTFLAFFTSVCYYYLCAKEISNIPV